MRTAPTGRARRPRFWLSILLHLTIPCTWIAARAQQGAQQSPQQSVEDARRLVLEKAKKVPTNELIQRLRGARILDDRGQSLTRLLSEAKSALLAAERRRGNLRDSKSSLDKVDSVLNQSPSITKKELAERLRKEGLSLAEMRDAAELRATEKQIEELEKIVTDLKDDLSRYNRDAKDSRTPPDTSRLPSGDDQEAKMKRLKEELKHLGRERAEVPKIHSSPNPEEGSTNLEFLDQFRKP